MSDKLILFGRALARRCPRCGTSGVMSSQFKVRKRCRGCELEFEREEGYWLGAMAINTGLAMAVFAVAFGGGLALTWPDVPWTNLTIAVGALMLVVPLLAFGHSRTLWVAIDFVLNGWEPWPNLKVKNPS